MWQSKSDAEIIKELYPKWHFLIRILSPVTSIGGLFSLYTPLIWFIYTSEVRSGWMYYLIGIALAVFPLLVLYFWFKVFPRIDRLRKKYDDEMNRRFQP